MSLSQSAQLCASTLLVRLSSAGFVVKPSVADLVLLGVAADTLETTDLWKKISFFVCIPGIAVCALWTYKAEMAHKAHAA